MAELLRGAPVAASLTEELSYRTRALRSRGIEPILAIVRVGERSDDLAYERGALKGPPSRGLRAGGAHRRHRVRKCRCLRPRLPHVQPSSPSSR